MQHALRPSWLVNEGTRAALGLWEARACRHGAKVFNPQQRPTNLEVKLQLLCAYSSVLAWPVTLKSSVWAVNCVLLARSPRRVTGVDQRFLAILA